MSRHPVESKARSKIMVVRLTPTEMKLYSKLARCRKQTLSDLVRSLLKIEQGLHEEAASMKRKIESHAQAR
jgi:hypothetical protein